MPPRRVPSQMGHNAGVSRVVRVRGEPPADAAAAGQAFGSTLRIRLIRHYLDDPGSQKSAADDLGISRSLTSLNTKMLMEIGVVVRDGSAYRVDVARLQNLQHALDAYFA